MKGLFKGMKYISQLFVYKEQQHEMQIGTPTDVKLVAHIGLEDTSSSSPSWMNEFKASPSPGFSSGSLSNIASNNSWTSPELNKPKQHQPPLTELPRDIQKRRRRKGKASCSSPGSTMSSASAESFSSAIQEPDRNRY